MIATVYLTLPQRLYCWLLGEWSRFKVCVGVPKFPVKFKAMCNVTDEEEIQNMVSCVFLGLVQYLQLNPQKLLVKYRKINGSTITVCS